MEENWTIVCFVKIFIWLDLWYFVINIGQNIKTFIIIIKTVLFHECGLSDQSSQPEQIIFGDWTVYKFLKYSSIKY